MFHKDLTGKNLHAPSRFLVVNDTGLTIAAGLVVQAANYGSLNYLSVTLGASNAGSIVFGVTETSIPASGGTGYITCYGILQDFDTSAWAVGTKLYSDGSGNLTTTVVGEIIATVLKQDSLYGALYVEPPSASGGGGGAVNSVFGRIGSITAQSGDYTTAQVTESGNLYFTNARAQAAITGTANNISVTSGVVNLIATAVTAGNYTNASISVDAFGRITAASSGAGGGVFSFNSRTGAVTPQSGDYTTSIVAEGSNLYFTNARAQAAITGAASTVVSANLTPSVVLISDGSGKISASSVSTTTLSYLDATSSIQTQLNNKQNILTLGTVSTSTSGINFGGTVSNAVIGPGFSIDINTASASQNGLLSSGDWSNFNSKQAAITGAASTVTSANLTINRVLISDGSGKIAVSTATTTALSYLDATSSIQTQLNGKLNLSGGTMLGLLTLAVNPTNPFDAATKSYVDGLINGLKWKDAAEFATTSALPSYTYYNGPSNDGVGSTITANSNGAFPVIDGYPAILNDRGLVKDESGANQIVNGIYYLSQVGNAGSPWILTRSTDADSGTLLRNATADVINGTQNGGSGFVQTVDPVTIGTTPIIWVKAFNTIYTTDGLGLNIIGNTLSLTLDGTTLSKSVSGLKVAAGGITNTEISATAAIARTKIATGNAYRLVINDATGIMNEAAAIGVNFVLISDANGIPEASSVSTTTLSYLDATSSIQTQLNGKEPVITAGTISQYWRGDKTFQTLSTSVVPEGSNLYFTNARARTAISATSPINYNNSTGALTLGVVPNTLGGTGGDSSGSNGFARLTSGTWSYGALLASDIPSLPANQIPQVSTSTDGYLAAEQYAQIEYEFAHDLKNTSYYKTFTYTGSNVTTIKIYTDSTLAVQTYQKDFTYTGSNLTQIVITRKSDNVTQTKTLGYSGGNIVNIGAV